jgi:hypothetical protein
MASPAAIEPRTTSPMWPRRVSALVAGVMLVAVAAAFMNLTSPLDLDTDV